MSDFSFELTGEDKGILRYKDKKCGTFEKIDGSYSVDIAVPARKGLWTKEFRKSQEKIDAFFSTPGHGVAKEVEKVEEPEESYDEILAKWKADLMAQAAADGNIAAILDDGTGVIYKGPATAETLKQIKAIPNVLEVLNEA
jgi:hypothetical protein